MDTELMTYSKPMKARLAGTQQEILAHGSLQLLVDGVKWLFPVLVTGHRLFLGKGRSRLQWIHGVCKEVLRTHEILTFCCVCHSFGKTDLC